MLHNLFRRRAGAARRTKARPFAAPRARLSLEALEGREVPALVFTVTTGANAGPGSLRQAILDSNAAPEMDQIVFQVGGITLTSALPDVTDTVEMIGLAGPGGGTTIMRSPMAPRFRILNIYPNGELFILRNLQLWSGFAPVGEDGGAIKSQGELILENCTVANSQADGAGGGIFQQMANLTLLGCLIDNNDAGVDGGGVYFASQSQTLTVVDSLVRQNTAQRHGGGIFYQALGICQLTDTDLWNNVCFTGWGGGLYAAGAVIRYSGGDVIANSAAGGRGGGFYLRVQFRADIALDALIGNRALDGPTSGGLIQLVGAAMYSFFAAVIMDNPEPVVEVI